MAARDSLAALYFGQGSAARRWRAGLALFDLAAMSFVVATFFLPRAPWVEAVDIALGLTIALDYGLRVYAARDRRAEALGTLGLIDLLVIASFLAPLAGEGLAFLRLARLIRLLRSFHLLRRLRRDWRWLRLYEQTLMAGLNLLLFVLAMTALVYETQVGRNPKITDYLDALYFTVTTLTTTGFGDITLEGRDGRLIAVLVMIFGVSLFIRLIQLLVRPPKVDHPCPTCGLRRHDFDAVHCKACGTVLNIEDEGAV